MEYFRKVVELADDYVRSHEAKMKWMWGEALLGYALSELDAALDEDRYLPFISDYCKYWLEKNPRVDQADTSAPALITYAVQKKNPDRGYQALTDKVLNYIRNEPRVLDDAVNHLGNSPEGRLYPKSIWVDSLMMFSVFPARFAAENDDTELLNFAARQPRLYAGYMQDKQAGLWYHSYWVKSRRPYPGREIFWGRGNGWVIAALPMILDYLPEDHPEQPGILEILEETSSALLSFQREDGWWNTLLENPGGCYRESSATALIAAGWMASVRKGYLGETYREPALKAYRSVVESLETGPGNNYLHMPEISGPTIPLQLLPRLGYRGVKTKQDWSYGVAALIFAAIEYKALQENSLRDTTSREMTS